MTNDRTTAGEWLVGGGQMGELIRSTDWSHTPLGPREHWPSAMRAVVNVVVSSRFPMALLWGRELLFIYNDAYAEIAGERHPGALGRSPREIWPEVWDINEPIFKAVMERGETVYLKDKLFPIDRRGHREDAYFTLSYSPVRVDDGSVGGTLVTLLETTQRVHQHWAQQERLRVTFENVALGIIEAGTDARIQSVNRRLGVLLGYEPNELTGKSIYELTAPEDRDHSRQLNGSLLRGELDTFNYEKRYLKKDGVPVWVRVTVSAIRDAGGVVVGTLGTVEDISERKQVEEELDRERTLLQAVFDNIPVLLVRWDPRLKRFALNRTAEAVLGWSTDEANAGDMMSMVYPDPDYRARVSAYMQSLQPGFHEWTVATKGGDRIPIEWANVRLRDDTAIGIGVDLRERKRIEEALREAFAKAEAGDRMLAALMGNVPEGITICDGAGIVQMVSRHGQELLGAPHVDRSIGEVVREWAVHRPGRHELMPIEELPLARALKGETVQDFEIVEINSEGRELPLLCNAGPIRDEAGKVVGGVVVWRDITERKRVEEALRRSEERLRLAQQVARIGTFEFYPQTNTSKWSPELEMLHGLPPGGYDGTYEQWATLVHPDDLHDVERCLREALGTGAFDAEWRVVCPDGTMSWLAGRGQVFHDDAGKPVLMLGVNVDITQRKRTEERLRESEQRNRLVVDELPSGLIVADLATGGLHWNKAALAMHGYEGNEDVHVFFESIPREYELLSVDGTPMPIEHWPLPRLLAGEDFHELEILVRNRCFGWERIFSCSGVVVRQNGSKATGLLSIRDITDRKRAERELRRSEEKFRSVFEQSAIGMGRVRFSDACWIDVNEAFCHMLGRSREEMLTTPWPEITHPDDVDLDLVQFRRMARGELDSYTVEKRFIHKNGAHVWTRLTLSLVRDVARHPDYEVAIIEDIAERKRAEEALRASRSQLEAERARLQAIVETLPVGFFVLDERGAMTLVNDSMRRMWAVDPQLHCPVDYSEYKGYRPGTGEPLSAEDWPCAQALKGKRVDGVVIDIERFDGSRATMLVSSAPIRDESGRVVGAVAANQDITELRAAEAKLLEADRRKNEFLAMLSHELRNPLAPIKNSLYILDRATPGGQQAKRAKEVIDRQVQHMTRLVDDLLDVTRISRGKIRLQKERLELCDLVRRTAGDHRPVFKAAGVDLKVETCAGPLYVEGDPTRLAQAIGNLLGNAVKFTASGGWVELRLSSESDRASIHVRDNGAGIAPELLEKLFQPFVQADTTLDRSKGGLGLGLALVRGLIDLHGGSVVARSEGAGKGAEFTLTLPMKTEETPSSQRVGHQANAVNKVMRVLLIEDNVDAAESLKEALELNGHEVVTAGTGLEGIDKARAFRPDVVLCDIGLPGMDGFEVARRMRDDPILRAACLIALSGYAGPEDLEKSRDAGFVHHVAKPPDLVRLENTLSQACSTRIDDGELGG